MSIASSSSSSSSSQYYSLPSCDGPNNQFIISKQSENNGESLKATTLIHSSGSSMLSSSEVTYVLKKLNRSSGDEEVDFTTEDDESCDTSQDENDQILQKQFTEIQNLTNLLMVHIKSVSQKTNALKAVIERGEPIEDSKLLSIDFEFCLAKKDMDSLFRPHFIYELREISDAYRIKEIVQDIFTSLNLLGEVVHYWTFDINTFINYTGHKSVYTEKLPSTYKSILEQYKGIYSKCDAISQKLKFIGV